MQPPLVLCSLAITALLSGCATGSHYANTPTPDATTIVASSVSPENFQSEGGMLVKVEKIDGAIAPEPPLYLVPGLHHLTIRLIDRLNNQAIVSTSIFVGAQQSFRVEASKQDQLYVIQVINATSGETVCTETVAGHYEPIKALGL
jgi:hypothetical protein